MKKFTKLLVAFVMLTITCFVSGCGTKGGSLEFKVEPTKIEYFINEELDVSGGVVNYVQKKDGVPVQKILTKEMVSNFDTTTTGVKNAIVTYNECTTTYNYSVRGALAEGLVYEIIVDDTNPSNINRIYLICRSYTEAYITRITTTEDYTKSQVMQNFTSLSPEILTFTMSNNLGVYKETSIVTGENFSETTTLYDVTKNSIKIRIEGIDGSYVIYNEYAGTLMHF